MEMFLFWFLGSNCCRFSAARTTPTSSTGPSIWKRWPYPTVQKRGWGGSVTIPGSVFPDIKSVAQGKVFSTELCWHQRMVGKHFEEPVRKFFSLKAYFSFCYVPITLETDPRLTLNGPPSWWSTNFAHAQSQNIFLRNPSILFWMSVAQHFHMVRSRTSIDICAQCVKSRKLRSWSKMPHRVWDLYWLGKMTCLLKTVLGSALN